MDAAKTLTSGKFYIHLALVVGLMIGIGFLPPIGSITPFGMKVLGVFIGSLVGWGLGYSGWVSFLGLILLGFMAPEGDIGSVFTTSYGSINLLVVLFGFMFCHGLSETGVVQYIANLILSRKFASKGPWMVTLAFWIASAVCSALICIAVTGLILSWSLFYAVVEKTGVEKKSKWVAISLITMCVTCLSGSLIMPYCAWNLMTYGIASAAVEGFTVNFLAHFILMLVINAALIALLFVVCRFVIGRDVKFDRELTSLVDAKDVKLNKRAAYGLVYLVILSLLMFLPSVLPADLPIMPWLQRLTMIGGFLIVMVLMAVTHVDGKPLMSLEDAIKNTPWSMFFLLTSALYMATIMATPEVGISDTIVTVLNGALGDFPVFVVMGILLVLGILATNAVNNLVCLNVFAPIGCSMMAAMGGSVGAMAALFSLGLYLGIILPSGSAIGAIAHGNTEWLDTKQVYIYGVLDIVVIIMVMLFIGIPLGTALF